MRKHGLGISSAQSMRAIKQVAETLGFKDSDDMLVKIGNGKESAQLVANRLLKILVDKGTEDARKARHWHFGLFNRQDASYAHERQASEEARDTCGQRHRGARHRRCPRAPFALLQPGSGR